MNCVTLFVLLKSDLDVQQAPASLLNKSSYLAAALGFAKFIILITMDYVTLFVVLKSYNKPICCHTAQEAKTSTFLLPYPCLQIHDGILLG